MIRQKNFYLTDWMRFHRRVEWSGLFPWLQQRWLF